MSEKKLPDELFKVTTQIRFTDELHNHLVNTASNRAQNFGWKTKKHIEMQHELFCGAVAAIDLLNGQIGIEEGKTCLTPSVYLDILRGNLITKK